MSGGKWRYRQFELSAAAQDIAHIVAQRELPPSERSEKYLEEYPDDVMDNYRRAIPILKLASICWHRIDYLESYDDGFDTFMSRLREDIEAEGLGYVWDALGEAVKAKGKTG